MTADRETLESIREAVCEGCKGDGACWWDESCWQGCDAFQAILVESERANE